MMVIPETALFAASLVSWKRELAILALSLAIFFSGLNPLLGTPVTLKEPLASDITASYQQARWFDQHYHGGTVLVGTAPTVVMVFATGLPDQDFLNENTPTAFDQAIAAPQRYVTWIVIGRGSTMTYDAVRVRLAGRTDWQRYYILRTTIDGMQFYQRIGSE